MNYRLLAETAYVKLVATEERAPCITYLRDSVAHKEDAGSQAVCAVGEMHIRFELESGK